MAKPSQNLLLFIINLYIIVKNYITKLEMKREKICFFNNLPINVRDLWFRRLCHILYQQG